MSAPNTPTTSAQSGSALSKTSTRASKFAASTGPDVYKTDVLWTTPSADRDECDQRKDDFNACYGAMIAAVTGGPMRSNRMARFTHPEGFPDPAALFEVQIKAVAGETVSISGGTIDYGTWIDHQPSAPRSCTSAMAK